MISLSDPIIIEGNSPGPTLVILGGVHGNEICGIQLIDLLKGLHIERGRLILAYGNPRAIGERTRLTAENLNRMFLPDDQLSSFQRISYEYERSRQLMPFLDQADVLLDVHSSNTLESIPFVIAEQPGAAVASVLPVHIRCFGFDAMHPGSTDGYMNRRSRIGICLECGSNDAPDAFERARRGSFALMSYLQMISSQEGSVTFSSQTVFQAYSIYKTRTEHFSLRRPYADFAPIKRGEIMADDGDHPVYSEFDQHIIFARPQLKKRGEDGFVLLKQQ